MSNRKLDYVTTKQLMQLSGIGSRDTVRAYETAGLIESTTPTERPRGKGPAKFWKRECVQICVRVKAMRRDGLDFDQIRKELSRKTKHTTASTDNKRKPRPDGIESQQRMISLADARAFTTFEAVFRDAKRLSRFIRDTTTNELFAEKLWREAIRTAKSGQRPFLVIAEKEIKVVDESEMRHRTSSLGIAVLVVPLAAYFDVEIAKANGKATNSSEQRVIELS